MIDKVWHDSKAIMVETMLSREENDNLKDTGNLSKLKMRLVLLR